MRREMLVEGAPDDPDLEPCMTPAGNSLKGPQPQSPDSEGEDRKPVFRDAGCQGEKELQVQVKEEQLEAGEKGDCSEHRDSCSPEEEAEPLPESVLKEEQEEAACTEISANKTPGLTWGSGPHSKAPASSAPAYASLHNPAESDSDERPHPDPISFKSASESSRCSLEVSLNSPSAASSPGLMMSVSPVPSSSAPISPSPPSTAATKAQTSSPATDMGCAAPNAPKLSTNIQRRHEKMANLNSIIHRLEKAANRDEALEWEF